MSPCPLHNAGDWPSAIKKLSATLSANPNDQPVEIVLKYMSLVKQAGDAAPAVRSWHTPSEKVSSGIDNRLLAHTQDWKGYRVIDGSLPEPYETGV